MRRSHRRERALHLRRAVKFLLCRQKRATSATLHKARAHTIAVLFGRRMERNVAWLSDASGEYQLMVGDPMGVSPARAIALPDKAFFDRLTWSPDGAHICLEDNHDNLWAIDVASGSCYKDRHRLLSRSGQAIQRHVVARFEMDHLLKESRQSFASYLRLFAGPIRSRTRLPTVSLIRSRRPSMPVASISTSWPAPTTARALAGWK